MAKVPRKIVLDSFAILALLQDEPGGEVVSQILHQAQDRLLQAAISTINIGEVLYLIERRYGVERAASVLSFLLEGPFTLYEASFSRVLAAAHLKARFPISYADAFAAALAQELDAVLLTGDPEFRVLKDIISVQWLSQNKKGK